MVNNFKDCFFYHCYDCGYGDRGYDMFSLSYDEAYELIKEKASKDLADNWSLSELQEIKFCSGSYIADEYLIIDSVFNEYDWRSLPDF